MSNKYLFGSRSLLLYNQNHPKGIFFSFCVGTKSNEGFLNGTGQGGNCSTNRWPYGRPNLQEPLLNAYIYLRNSAFFSPPKIFIGLLLCRCFEVSKVIRSHTFAVNRTRGRLWFAINLAAAIVEQHEKARAKNRRSGG